MRITKILFISLRNSDMQKYFPSFFCVLEFFKQKKHTKHHEVKSNVKLYFNNFGETLQFHSSCHQLAPEPGNNSEKSVTF